jgi:diadenosine tetraphosphatase ApaH/serine/threonine PP2A family protein phosphatase
MHGRRRVAGGVACAHGGEAAELGRMRPNAAKLGRMRACEVRAGAGVRGACELRVRARYVLERARCALERARYVCVRGAAGCDRVLAVWAVRGPKCGRKVRAVPLEGGRGVGGCRKLL